MAIREPTQDEVMRLVSAIQQLVNLLQSQEHTNSSPSPMQQQIQSVKPAIPVGSPKTWSSKDSKMSTTSMPLPSPKSKAPSLSSTSNKGLMTPQTKAMAPKPSKPVSVLGKVSEDRDD